MANPFVHVELAKQDLEKSKKFYTSLFNWKLEEIPGMDYTIINVGEGTGGGMMKKPDPGIPDNWLTWPRTWTSSFTTIRQPSIPHPIFCTQAHLDT